MTNIVEIILSEDLRGSAHGLLKLLLRQISLGSMWHGRISSPQRSQEVKSEEGTWKQGQSSPSS